MKRTLANWGFFSLVVGLAAAGCTTPAEKIRITETGAADFQQLAIVYDAELDRRPGAGNSARLRAAGQPFGDGPNKSATGE